MKGKRADKIFFWIVAALVSGGFFIFISASLGVLARGGARFSSIAFNQIFFGLILGTIAFFFISNIHYRFWQKYSFYIFIGALILTLAVFIPGIGFSHGGATRWLSLGPFSLQPSEILKIATIIYLAAWLTSIKDKVKSFKEGFLPFVGILGAVGLVILSQPDTDTFLVIIIAAISMFFVAGGRWRHLGILLLSGLIAGSLLIATRPYVKERVMTFLNPETDPLGASWQIQQSLIAIGSGQIFGRGMGQSIQKFNYLPEPIGDSIFAVFAEEWGFVGSITLIILFVLFLLRGLRISSRATSNFPQLLALGIIVLIVSQSFINIASMLALFPLSGIPLVFVSHGGTSLLFSLAAVGIVLNISKYQKSSSTP